MRPRRQIIVVVVASCTALCTLTAGAAMVYRWVDEKGVVHFGDAPPAGSRDYTSKTLPDAPPAPEPMPADAAAKAEALPPASGTPRQGAAHVVLLESRTIALGPARQAIRGKVKNDGGAEARDIVISVRVTEPIQGAECLRDVIDVEPSTLAPGAEGSFDAEFDNPCFHGPTNAALTAEWR